MMTIAHRVRAAMLASVVAICLVTGPARADDGHRLWLRYDRLAPAVAARDAPRLAAIWTADGALPGPLAAADGELARALAGFLGHPVTQASGGGPIAGALVTGTLDQPVIGALHLPVRPVGDEGYVIASVRIAGRPVTVIAANRPVGVLYGAFALIRRIQRDLPLDHLAIASAPKLKLRVLDHWDNLDGSVERGYAGRSIWDWADLPSHVDPRITDYARANASIGINGAVLNNVNASAQSLTAPYIARAAAIADALRPWGMRVYLSARWSAPMELGGLKDADPLDPAVAAWWRAKADEIYRAIPDFGGFLVKADSEGQPGPQDYHRTHADGANMLAAALAPHGGVVMWRAFVYGGGAGEDRARQAYDQFRPLDGRFAANVLLQVKNGPIDFQPREPFHPLFGAMPRTALMPEFQITKEYLGMATHLVYLGALFAETLHSDTMADGPGSTVARIVERGPLTGIAGVANVGDDADWTGSIFNQANWYAYGRLAWDPDGSARAIAAEWSDLTFGTDPDVRRTVVAMMMTSREAVVDYMTPLGLAHQMGTTYHYGPAPWVSDLSRPEWNPTYYARAGRDGIGFDRTRIGSDAVDQYAPPVSRCFADLACIADRDLLWFHHVPWDYRLHSGETLWQGLADHYRRGVAEVAAMQAQWARLKGRIDPERFAETARDLAIQHHEAIWWRDAMMLWFAHVSGRALPAGYPRPAHDLAYYQALKYPQSPSP